MRFIGRIILILLMLAPAGYGVYSLYRQRDLAEQEGRVEGLKKEISTLTDDRNRLDGTVKSKKALEDWGERLDAREKVLMNRERGLIEKGQALTNQIAEAEVRVAAVTKQAVMEKERLLVIEKSVASAEARRDKLGGENEKLDADRERLRSDKDDLVRKISADQRSLLNLSNELASVSLKIVSASNRLSGINHEIDETVDKRIKELQDLQKRRAKIAKEVEVLELKIREQRLETNNLHLAIMSETSLQAGARKRKLDAERDADAAVAATNRAKDELAREEDLRKKAEERKAEAESRARKAEAEAEDAKKRAEDEKVKADVVVRKSGVETAALKAESDRLKGEIDSLLPTLKKVQDLVSVTNGLARDISFLMLKKDGLATEVAALDARRVNLKSEVLQLERKYNEVQRNIVHRIQKIAVPVVTNMIENIERN